jgi:hypothetical protein
LKKDKKLTPSGLDLEMPEIAVLKNSRPLFFLTGKIQRIADVESLLTGV